MSVVGQDLISALSEALEDAKGKKQLRTTRLNVSPVCEKMDASEIKETRKRLGLTQGVFAIVIGVSQKTVESWETGRYSPDGAARRLISVIQKDPNFLEEYGILRR